jgi:hypothetical protein
VTGKLLVVALLLAGCNTDTTVLGCRIETTEVIQGTTQEWTGDAARQWREYLEKRDGKTVTPRYRTTMEC